MKLMKTPSIILIFLVLSLFACSQSDDETSGGSVEGNTVVAEVEVDSVKVMQESAATREGDTTKMEYWYEIRFDSPKEEYYSRANDEWTASCQIFLYPEQNGVYYIEVNETSNYGEGTTFITLTKDGIVINEKWHLSYSEVSQRKNNDYNKIKEKCESGGGKFIAHTKQTSSQLHLSCVSIVPSLSETVEDALKGYAEQYKQFCKEDGL